MVLNTREKLIEVARQLFVNKGVENTTMSDIATASERGRRTLYTYFKSKHEIYEATIEHDSDRMVERLRNIVSEVTTPIDKLEGFLRYRLDVFEVKRSPSIGKNINSLLHLDFNRIERVRKLAIKKEKQILDSILSEGVEKGIFDIEMTNVFMPVVQLLLQGVDLSIARNNFEVIDLKSDTYKDDIVKFIINSLLDNNIKTKKNETT
ncbi:MAG: TetR/AcrR family transcriptional regulator [Bacteroidales bacterium]|nr:TetR/AcrR family transcriptional regulator [Bacteroidales bacterium]